MCSKRIHPIPHVLATIGVLMCVAAAQAQFQPDLIVSRIDILPSSPAPGQDITVTVTTVNVGNATPVSETWMYLYHDSAAQPVPCSFDQLDDLLVAFPPETQRIFTFTVNYANPGTYRLWAWVDGCESLIAEANEGNNWLSRDITVGAGDLSIDSIETSIADPVPGQPFFLNVTVRNGGPAFAGLWSCGVAYESNEPLLCTFDQTEQRVSFPAFSTFVLSFGPIQYPTVGSYPVWAWVNCDGNVDEVDSTNNKRFAEMVLGQPDLVIDSITASTTTPQILTPVDVEVVVRNAGSADAGAFRVSAVNDGATEPTGDGCALADFVYVTNGLEVGATFTHSFQVTYADATAHRFWVWADSCADNVPEAREDNNKADINIVAGTIAPGLPDLVVENITTTNIADPTWGEVVVFDVTVSNIGVYGAGPFRVGDFVHSSFPGTHPSSYVVIGSPGPSRGGGAASVDTWNDCAWRTREVSSLAAGASTTVQFWRRFYESGRRSFSATVDACGGAPNYAVYESAEGNNWQTIDFDVIGCDADRDFDGICDDEDFCPDLADALNNDSDNDGEGDLCDDDDDNDGVLDVDDCAPRDRFIYPGAFENCTDGIDNNCDGVIDEGALTWYRDTDGDGFGDAGAAAVDCTAPAGYVGNPDDCDDTRANVYPGANGPCDDGLDNDCDGVVDNEIPVWGRDADGDGFTNPGDEITDDGVCDGQPAGYILTSATPDPDDADFMVPEPVVADPTAIEIRTPAGAQVNTGLLTLTRNGPEPFDFAVTVTYGPEAADWIALEPAAGTADGGEAGIVLTPQVAGLDLAAYEATLSVTINGVPEMDVPVLLVVRNPILRIVRRGQGGGGVWAEYYDNARGLSVYLGSFDTEEGTFALEVNVPLYEGVYLYDSADDCSIANGFYLNGMRLVEDPAEGRVGPLLIDRDITIEADFAPNYLLCTSCATILFTLNIVGLCLTRPRRRFR